jgi:hypothetical protein
MKYEWDMYEMLLTFKILIFIQDPFIQNHILTNRWVYPDTDIIEAFIRMPMNIDESTSFPPFNWTENPKDRRLRLPKIH